MVRAMSPAQRKLMDENFMAFINWMEKAGCTLGFKIQPWQRRIVEAMQKKGFLTEDLRVTEVGKKAWEKSVSNMGRRQKRA